MDILFVISSNFNNNYQNNNYIPRIDRYHKYNDYYVDRLKDNISKQKPNHNIP